MTDITEYGDLIINAYLDEWGRRKIDGLLEDGVKILITVGAPIIKTWTALLNTSHVFSRPFRSFRLTQTLNLTHAFIRHRFTRLTQALQTLHTWTVTYPSLILKQWLATLQTVHTLKRPYRLIQITETLQTTHVFNRPVRTVKLPAIIRLIHAHFVAVPGVKRTKLFLIIGDLAIQLSND